MQAPGRFRKGPARAARRRNEVALHRWRDRRAIREDMERQRKQMERTLSYTQTNALRPRSRLRITSSGLEAVIRFPVTLQNAAEIDDRVTRELLKAIDREPKLKLVGSSLRLNTEVVAAASES